MSYVEIEVRAKTVDLAVEAAMQELGVDDRERLDIEVIQEPERGFLGIGGQDAVVRVRRRPGRRSRDRKRGRGGEGRARNERENGRPVRQNDQTKQHSTPKKGKEQPMSQEKSRRADDPDDRPVVSIDRQAEIAKDFLEGLVSAYGLEGSVTVRIEDDVIVADVTGDQTEALVGVRGTVRSAIHELTRTVMQRYTQDAARLRLDVAGYADRRRQALTIYAEQLIEQVTTEGGEIMLEPMSASDRKVIHDVAAAHPGVTSYSEGEPPQRYVVLAAVAGGDEEE